MRFTEVIRHQQADYVRELVDLLLADDPDDNLVVGGGLTTFPFPEPNEGLDTVTRVSNRLPLR